MEFGDAVSFFWSEIDTVSSGNLSKFESQIFKTCKSAKNTFENGKSWKLYDYPATSYGTHGTSEVRWL